MPPTTSSASVRRAVAASAVGTIVEWYDFALYGAASALVIGPLFFTSASKTAGILSAFATFAVGYFARPIGGLIFAHIGDRLGRRKALVWSVAVMGISTMLIGALPTYSSVGIWAPVLLVLLRLTQGFGAGAEFAGAVTLLAEYTPRNRHGVYTSVPYAGAAAGVLFATLTFFGAAEISQDALLTWGWRIPFLSSVLMFALALFIRYRLQETPEFVKLSEQGEKQPRLPLVELLRYRKKNVVAGFLSLVGFNTNSYTLNTFALTYLTVTLGLAYSQALLAVVLAAVAAIIGGPLLGWVADKTSYKSVFIFGAGFVAVMAFPFFFFLQTKNMFLVVIAMVLGYGIGYGAMSGPQGAFLSRLFDTRYRFTGVALAREANGALVAGPTPLIAGVLVASAGGAPWLLAGYLVIAQIVTILVVALAKGATSTELPQPEAEVVAAERPSSTVPGM